MAVLIKGGNVYAPEDLGKQDILMIGKQIVRIAGDIDFKDIAAFIPDVEIIEACGQIVVPGFIDPHVHLIGGGGESGFDSRTPEVTLSKIIEAGVTTVAGLLGTDGHARNMEALYAKAKGLEKEGVSTLLYTGSYKIPSVTITGSVAKDILFIDKVIGVKIALSDHRSSHITFDELSRLASDVRVAGMLSDKPGLVHIHMGSGKSRLDLVMKVVEETDIPITHFLPTHVTRSEEMLSAAKKFAKKGGRIDITSYAELKPEGNIQPSKAILECIRDGVPVENITVSSDGNGSVPRYDEKGNVIGIGIGRLDSSILVFKNLIRTEKLDISAALPFFTINAAKVLAIYPNKGCIRAGSDADVLILDSDLNLKTVFALGRKMMDQGTLLVKGMFEE